MTQSTTLLGCLATVGVALVGYLIYFDQKRQKDPEFRKELRRQRRQREKTAKENELKTETKRETEINLDEFLNQPVPDTPEAKEQFFVKSLRLAEDLLAKGPAFYAAAAQCFYKVLQMYPDPMQLLMIFEQSIPPPAFNMVMELMAKDVNKQKEEDSSRIIPLEEEE